MMIKFIRTTSIFIIGAVVYPILEILFRGYSHWSMSIAGGLSFLAIYSINRWFRHSSLGIRCALGALSITAIEFGIGCFVNLYLHLDVWNYSHIPLHLLGQICLPFTALWFVLCIPALKLSTLLDRLFLSIQTQIQQKLHPSASSESHTETAA